MKYALLGCGKIGQLHWNAVQQLTDHFEVVATIDPGKNAFNGVPHFESLQQFLDSDITCELIAICTPNGLHFDQAKQCLQKGINCLVEKPIALHPKQTLELVSLAQEKNLRVFANMQLRFSPAIEWLKKHIQENFLGQIYFVNAQCYWNRTKQYYEQRAWHGTKDMDGGVLFTQFSHYVDILHYLFGELSIEKSSQYNFNHHEITDFGDSGKIDFLASSGAVGNFIYTTSVYQKNFESSIQIIGEKGTIKIGDQYLNKILYSNVEGLAEFPQFDEQKNFHPLLYANVCNAIKANKPSIVDGEHAAALIDFMHSASH